MTTKIELSPFLVAGTKYRCEAGNLRTFSEGSTLMLRREPENPHDPNAIGVYANIQDRMSKPTYLHIGYIPKELAKYFSPMMAEGLRLSAIVRRIEPTKLLVWAMLVWEKDSPDLMPAVAEDWIIDEDPNEWEAVEDETRESVEDD